jgi:putative tricarboxylic transport membrane protein
VDEGAKEMHDQGNVPEGASLASNRVLEIVVALALLTVSAIIIYDSIRLGFGWVEGEGPAAGYFPFYIASVLGIASLVILLKAVLGNSDELKESFVSRVAFGRVLTVLLPAIVYVAAIQYIGFYVASGLFLVIFMMTIGRESVLRSIGVGIAVPLFFFVMFERWFLVPLPKGPLEAMLGF